MEKVKYQSTDNKKIEIKVDNLSKNEEISDWDTYKRAHGKLIEMFWHTQGFLSIRKGWMYMNT